MPGVAENAIERPFVMPLRDNQSILANWETTSRCAYSNICSSRCLINQLNTHAGKDLPRTKLFQIAEEFLHSSAAKHVRHLCLLGKEVMEDVEVLFHVSSE